MFEYKDQFSHSDIDVTNNSYVVYADHYNGELVYGIEAAKEAASKAILRGAKTIEIKLIERYQTSYPTKRSGYKE